MATLITIGYGDVTPITPLGKTPLGLHCGPRNRALRSPRGIFASGFIEEMQRKTLHSIICPHCGELFDEQKREKET